jgi:hypothetical protein
MRADDDIGSHIDGGGDLIALDFETGWRDARINRAVNGKLNAVDTSQPESVDALKVRNNAEGNIHAAGDYLAW